jgi:hypothetical protein
MDTILEKNLAPFTQGRLNNYGQFFENDDP